VAGCERFPFAYLHSQCLFRNKFLKALRSAFRRDQLRFAGDLRYLATPPAFHSLFSGRVFISPYNDRDVIAGQGTIAVELHQQLSDIDAIFVAAGGGGLIGGIGAYMKAASPKTEIIGCWPENSPVLCRCLEADRILDVPEQPTLSESTAGGLEPGSITLDLCRAVVDRDVLVSESDILAAMRRSLAEDHWLIEGAAGVALAAYLREAKQYADKTAVVVICGRNLSNEVLHRLL
jgi:threonine dehydratase